MSALHSIILGITNSGKTTLAKKIAQQFLNANSNVYVFDPFASSGWHTKPDDKTQQYKFSNPDLFMQSLPTMRRGAVMIDEAAQLFIDYKNEMNALMMMGRQRGLRIFLLAQRYKTLPPNSRNNANLIYAFNQSPTDTYLIRDDYPPCIDLAKLHQGQYVALTHFSCSTIHKVF